MTMTKTKVEYDLDGWIPIPGFVLCRAIKREELQKSDSKLTLPDRVGKVSDSVGVGEVIATSLMLPNAVVEWLDMLNKLGEPEKPHFYTDIKPGDLIAWMPFVDMVIEIKLKKYSLVPYDKVRAIRKTN